MQVAKCDFQLSIPVSLWILLTTNIRDDSELCQKLKRAAEAALSQWSADRILKPEQQRCSSSRFFSSKTYRRR